MVRAHNFKNLTGKKFNRLDVIEESGRNNRGEILWKCKCECGNIKNIIGTHLKTGNTKSCGCLFTEKIIELGRLRKGENSVFYGRKHSKETIQKMSSAKKDKPRSTLTKNKISKSLMGRFVGENNSMFDKNHSEEVRQKISINRKGKCCGDDNPAWKGGISCEPYCYEWSFKEFKEYIKDRDGNKCLNPDCFGNLCRLGVHHIDYNKKNCVPQTLITLCASCNSRANKDREWHESWYKAIIYRRTV